MSEPIKKQPSGHYRDGAVWHPEDYSQNETHGIIERLSHSHYSLKEIVEQSRDQNPEAWNDAVEQALRQNAPTDNASNKWSTTPIKKLAKEFDTDLKKGLTNRQVELNREKYGLNFLEKEHMEPIWKLFLSQFKSAVVILLLIAAIVSLIFQEWAEGVVILLIVIINAVLATYMERSASNALAKLASLAAPHCMVIRDGEKKEIDAIEVVPGDICIVQTGDSLAADMRCIEIMELKCNEALLTGEPEDIKKTLEPKDPHTPFATNLCFSATSVTNGEGKCLAYATGMESQVGRVAQQLQATAGSSLTPLQKGLNRLGGLIGIIAICVLVLIVAVAILTDYKDPSKPDQEPALQIALVAVGFAVSSIPEGLPMVVTICLSLGCKDMVKRRANVRKLPAVETLGSCTVICSDKTGTLTEGKMTTVRVSTFCENAMEDFGVYPTKGFNPHGGIYSLDELDESARTRINVEFTHKTFNWDSHLTNHGNHGNNETISQRLRALCLAGALNSHGTTLKLNEKAWESIGNMSEGAVVVAAAKGGWSTLDDEVPEARNPIDLYPRVAALEVPFNSSRKMAASIHQLLEENKFDNIILNYGSDESYSHVAVLKGAPDKVFAFVKRKIRTTSNMNFVDWREEISESDRQALQEKNLEMSSEALRVLGFTIVPLRASDFEALQALQEAEERLTFLQSSGLVVVGVMGSLDPPRFGVRDAIETCRSAGVRVIMITGDQKPTAVAIGRDVGILTVDDDPEIAALVCADLRLNGDPQGDHIDDVELDLKTSQVNVFSRAQPEDKIKIVNSLKRQGHVVAMTGDGVNDAPALKAADIGVAMGINGTDVAKGASEMVLMDDNFVTIVSAIEEGRKIYGNIQKFVAFLLGTNIGEIIYLTTAILARMKMPLEALQILFLNLASDGCPAVALSREPADEDNMTNPPRRKDQPIVTMDWWIYGIFPHCILEAACVIGALCVAFYTCMGDIQLPKIELRCLKSPDGISPSGQNYFCYTNEYRVTSQYTGWVTNIDCVGNDGAMNQFLGYDEGFLTMDEITIPNECQCPVGGGGDDNGWCYPTEDTLRTLSEDVEALSAGLPSGGYEFTVTKASRIATTQSFIAAVFCEMLRAYTVRSWEWAHSVFNRNPWMHLACSFSFVATLILTIIPWINTIFGVTPLFWWQYLLAMSWGLVNLVGDELIPKPVYRMVRRKRKQKADALKPTVVQTHSGNSGDSTTEDEQQSSTSESSSSDEESEEAV
eukprot:GHVP01050744.1.p1 GENE.GHVP01050744.1~~GHVP01050744.1.p1  ORF type:complete len:1240 (-),score=214.13 GHVP01050744.1:1558-5277(-)